MIVRVTDVGDVITAICATAARAGAKHIFHYPIHGRPGLDILLSIPQLARRISMTALEKKRLGADKFLSCTEAKSSAGLHW